MTQAIDRMVTRQERRRDRIKAQIRRLEANLTRGTLQPLSHSRPASVMNYPPQLPHCSRPGSKDSFYELSTRPMSTGTRSGEGIAQDATRKEADRFNIITWQPQVLPERNATGLRPYLDASVPWRTTRPPYLQPIRDAAKIVPRTGRQLQTSRVNNIALRGQMSGILYEPSVAPHDFSFPRENLSVLYLGGVLDHRKMHPVNRLHMTI